MYGSSVVTTSIPIRRSLAINGMLMAGPEGTRDVSLASLRRSSHERGLSARPRRADRGELYRRYDSFIAAQLP